MASWSGGAVRHRDQLLAPGGSRYRSACPPTDDILFLRGATSIASGDWLGPFNQVTLAKGAAYPAFIAAMHVLGIPVKIGEQATYALACATGSR